MYCAPRDGSENGALVGRVVGEKGNVLEAGLADLVQDGFDIAVFGAGVGFDVDGFFGALACGLAEGIGEIGGQDAVVAKIGRPIACDGDFQGIFAARAGLQCRVLSD